MNPALRILLSSFLVVLLSDGKIFAQDDRKNTLPYDSLKGSPAANIGDLDWLVGYWSGEAMGGIVEEAWTPPTGGSMMGSFKVIKNGKVEFYEFLTISEENQSLVLKLKHFHPDLRGWEPQDKYYSFPLVKMEPGKAFFSNFTIESPDPQHLNVYVVFKNKEGIPKESKFSYQRQPLDQDKK